MVATCAFCHAFKKWLYWDGRRWAIDSTDQARRLAKHAMLETLRQTVHKGLGQAAENFARHSLDARRIASLLSMAEPEIYVTPEELDRAPYLLNVETGLLICVPAPSACTGAKTRSRSSFPPSFTPMPPPRTLSGSSAGFSQARANTAYSTTCRKPSAIR
jgi:hypothetical protein